MEELKAIKIQRTWRNHYYIVCPNCEDAMNYNSAFELYGTVVCCDCYWEHCKNRYIKNCGPCRNGLHPVFKDAYKQLLTKQE